MLFTVVVIVLLLGGDALSVCMNTVAIMFMTDADNIAYNVGLAQLQKARMETAGRVALTTKDSERLQQTEKVYNSIIIGGILIAVSQQSMSSGI